LAGASGFGFAEGESGFRLELSRSLGSPCFGEFEDFGPLDKMSFDLTKGTFGNEERGVELNGIGAFAFEKRGAGDE